MIVKNYHTLYVTLLILFLKFSFKSMILNNNKNNNNIQNNNCEVITWQRGQGH